ncbi:MAG: hypothetical protein ACI9XK_004611 [Granulosicoccus sp.]
MQGVADVSTVYIEFNIIYIMRNDVEFRQGADLRILTTWARQLMAFQCTETFFDLPENIVSENSYR